MVKNDAVFCNVLDIDSILPFKLLNFTILGRHSSKRTSKNNSPFLCFLYEIFQQHVKSDPGTFNTYKYV